MKRFIKKSGCFYTIGIVNLNSTYRFIGHDVQCIALALLTAYLRA